MSVLFLVVSPSVVCLCSCVHVCLYSNFLLCLPMLRVCLVPIGPVCLSDFLPVYLFEIGLLSSVVSVCSRLFLCSAWGFVGVCMFFAACNPIYFLLISF